ncbi:peptidase [Synechococcus phage ACG-2014a]|uniref:Peptidase n=1 Tax=Synechococcus phage ACG-2014a TaxID=1493507 RepID=A0A0E3HW97_9CAUD|nr:peptidase [Synechococcus phage ACG-2014a]
MNTQEVKGTLAKLLATENLTVEHRKVSTACFDVDKRLLILPIWKTASNTVYDLLVGHEVGHALYTPNEDFGKVSKAFVNVLEDARIEKMMKRTYPGLRRSFYDGYRELWNNDFFGVNDDDIEKLSLIDRINLYFKGNADISFTVEEQVWVDRTSNTKTFDDVVDLAKDLWKYANEKEDEKDHKVMPQSKDGNRSADTEQEGMTHEEMLEEAERREQENEEDGASEYSDSFEESYEFSETESITDGALSEALETLVDDSAKEWIYLTTPDVDVNEKIVPFKVVQENLNKHFHERVFHDETDQRYYTDNLNYALSHFNSFKKDTKKTVSYLCKQFEMKKSANEYKRTAVAKTGVVDTNKLFKYKLTEDIFKKVSVVQEGKNHGLVMHLDWSGSMQYQLLDTLKQVYNLIWFCKKCGIPFRVYAFQSGYGYRSAHDEEINQSENELGFSQDFRLLELFSSRQNAKSLEKSMQLVYTQVFSMNGYRLSHLPEYTLGGTPLAEAVYCTRQIVASMKRVENVTKVNVICLTDGEANPMSYIQAPSDNEIFYQKGDLRTKYLCHQRNKVFFLRDHITGYTRRINAHPNETTKEIVSFYREITDYNWIGIRICNKMELTRLVRETANDEFESVDKQWKKYKFASIKNKIGFTEAFFMPSQGIGGESQDLTVKCKKEIASKAELTRAFKKHMGSKMTNKTILNSFIEQIA